MSSYFPSLILPDTPMSVSVLTDYIQQLLEEDGNLQQIWVTGEVSSATRYRSGLFFTLQDLDANAAVNCVVWNSQLDRLASMPLQGAQIIVLGRLRIHAQRGQYQLIVWQILPAGEGLRALRYRQLRDRLEAEGLFDPLRRRPLPAHPMAVAVVTSPQAAAWGDIQRTLRRRYPGLWVLLSPALVQGEQAPESIVQAIHRVERDGRADVLILSRGGGAIEDMACFNDERVVRAVASCAIPVISGIGHQRDESLTDLVADLCVHTPTAAAEQAVPSLGDLYFDHQQRVAALQECVRDRLRSHQGRLHRLRDRLLSLKLDRRLKQERQLLTYQRRRLVNMTQLRMDQGVEHCQQLRQQLQALDPHAILRRGYALIRQQNGAIARSTRGLRPGQKLTVQLHQGEITVRILEIPSPQQPPVIE